MVDLPPGLVELDSPELRRRVEAWADALIQEENVDPGLREEVIEGALRCWESMAQGTSMKETLAVAKSLETTGLKTRGRGNPERYDWRGFIWEALALYELSHPDRNPPGLSWNGIEGQALLSRFQRFALTLLAALDPKADFPKRKTIWNIRDRRNKLAKRVD